MNGVIRVLLVSCLLTSPPPSSGQTLKAVLEEPSFEYMVDWKLDFALGVVVTVETDDGLLYLAYPILAQKSIRECMPYRQVGDEVKLMEGGTQFSVPSLPSLYRIDNEDWKMWDGTNKHNN